ncbi:hypothetical protein [Corallococcus sp. M7]
MVGLASLMVACGNGGSSSARKWQAQSGEKLFGDLAFREGVFAELYAEMGVRQSNRLTPQQQAARERSKATLLANMRQADPAFFDRFGVEVQSGNHLRIERTLRESAALVRKVSPKRALTSVGSTDNTESENTVYENTVSGNSEIGNTAYGNSIAGNMESGNTMEANTISGNDELENTESGNTYLTNTETGNIDSDNIASGNTTYDNTEVGNENSWRGAQLARDQMINKIATRLAVL